jgi:DNA polymerase III delta prime subunit
MAKTEMRYVGAYLIRGTADTLNVLLEKLEKENVIEKGSPDLFARSYRSFGVDEAEELRSRARTKPISAPQRVFAIATPGMTSEAQNSLLKTLEEPAANAVFFLILPAPETMLGTVRSRSQTLTLETKAFAGIVDVDNFLAAPAAKRLEMVKPLYDHDDDGRDMAGVLSFLSALEVRFAKGKLSAERDKGIRAIYRARKYAGDKGSLLKSLLEQVALLAPRM